MGCLPCNVVESIHANARQLFAGHVMEGVTLGRKLDQRTPSEGSINTQILINEAHEWQLLVSLMKSTTLYCEDLGPRPNPLVVCQRAFQPCPDSLSNFCKPRQATVFG